MLSQKDNNKWHTKTQMTKAKMARNLHQMMMCPSMADSKNAIEFNFAHDCLVTAEKQRKNKKLQRAIRQAPSGTNSFTFMEDHSVFQTGQGRKSIGDGTRINEISHRYEQYGQERPLVRCCELVEKWRE